MVTKLETAGSISKGGYILIDGVACRVVDVSHSKPGKHGAAKARILAIGLIDERKRDIVLGTGENVQVPIIEKKSAQVLSVSGDIASVMDLTSYETFDLKIPEDLKDQVTAGASIMYWDILGDKVMKQLKSAAES